VTEEYLQKLNPEQRAAVLAVDGPLLVLAGAGTGKTRVLTTRFAHILLSGRARPWEVLAVTFTNKAAREMRERVATILGRPADGLWLGTFHALCARMLRRHAELVGLKSNFTILDTDDQNRLLKQLMEAQRIDTKRWPVNGMMGVIQRWKDRGLAPGQVTAAEESDFAGGRATEIYRAYQARLLELNAADFGDLLLHVLTLLTQNEQVLAEYHRMFRYILVDEYQDTNTAQYLWLRLLAARPAPAPRNICCVGDDDQSIYSWRGAEIENILRFEKDFPGATIVRLEANYRSTRQILAAAAGLIARNQGRLGKTLRAGRADAEGERVRIASYWDSEEEARKVGDLIDAGRRAGHKLAETAILVRAGFQTRSFEERLIALGLPYRVVGGLKFYERSEIRDAMAYLRVVQQPADDLAFERIVNTPKRGLGDSGMQALRAASQRLGLPLSQAAARLVEGEALKPKPRTAIRDLLEGFTRWRALAETAGHVVAATTLLDESGYVEMWKQDRSPEAPGRLDNLKELLRAMGDYPSLGDFLDHVALVMETDEAAEADRVQIMTLHAAKGLEFDRVFLPGWEEGLFPSQRSMDEGGEKALEEERRLAYVGITRARVQAHISHAANRRIYGNWTSAIPSRFLDELPEEAVMRDTAARQSSPNMLGAPSMFASGPLVSARARPAGGSAWEVRERPPAAAPFRRGDRVFHSKFGDGTVVAVEEDRLDIAFDHAGKKRVLDRFLEKR